MRAAAGLLLCATLLLGACGEQNADLDAWMKDQGKNVKGKLDPTKSGSKLAPDFNRRKEPLEAFPLESLSMVGTLAKNKSVYALVRTPEKEVYQVRAGNYLGQNYGVITEVADGELKLKELIQDGAGDWTERSSTLQLQQTDQKK